jgi:catechol 2,3-dioxygenase-like lactoylglutathione lyase family enzyme
MKVLGAAPVLRVSNLASALRFYRDVLGFTVEFEYDDYVILELGQSQVHLATPDTGKPVGGGTVYVFCEEVDEYFGKIRARGESSSGLAVIREPGDQFYCMRDFRIHDPDGNELTFGRALSAEERARL